MFNGGPVEKKGDRKRMFSTKYSANIFFKIIIFIYFSFFYCNVINFNYICGVFI